MDTKIEIKEEDPLSDDTGSQNDIDVPTKYVKMKSNTDIALSDTDCEVAIKTEIKSETIFPDFCSQKQYCAKQFGKQIKSETVTCSSICERYMKTDVEEKTVVSDFGSQNNKDFLPEDPVNKFKKYINVHEVDNKIEIKVEPWWLETETSSICDDIKLGDFPPEKSSRLCMEAVSGVSHIKSPFPTAEVPERDTSFLNENYHVEYEGQEGEVPEFQSIEKCVNSEQSVNSSNREIYKSFLYSKQKSFSHKGKTSLMCSICEKSFKYMSELKCHEFIHAREKPHKCKICGKSFTKLSHLKRHKLIHEGKKPHQCVICDKNFTQLSTLKRHKLIHEDKKPHQCKTCDKSFTTSAHLKVHYLIHEGKKPHQCETCDKSFTQSSSLKRHNLIHEGNRPHQCKLCDKSFTLVSDLKRHILIHAHKKSHQCKFCNKSFTNLSQFNSHNLIHDGNTSQ